MGLERHEEFIDSRVFAELAHVVGALQRAVRGASVGRLKPIAAPGRRFTERFRRWAGVPYASFVEATIDSGSVHAGAHRLRLAGADRLAARVVRLAVPSHPDPMRRGFVWGRVLTPFGDGVLAESTVGLCHLEFFDVGTAGFVRAERALKARWPTAEWRRDDRRAEGLARRLFGRGRGTSRSDIDLHGSPFQLDVWRALLAADSRSVLTYGSLAQQLGCPGAARAIGTAVGGNRIGWLVPCHHVVTRHGLLAEGLGGFRWGVERKRAMLVWESVSPAS